MTTLCTVGYGDYFPTNSKERIISIIIQFGGVAFFSYIMGNFIEIISNYDKKMGVVDMSSDLNSWMFSLTRFT
jgi:potassium voltage-gated channel Eag-related subfamily H protein 8